MLLQNLQWPSLECLPEVPSIELNMQIWGMPKTKTVTVFDVKNETEQLILLYLDIINEA